jgi:hypothetical protein
MRDRFEKAGIGTSRPGEGPRWGCTTGNRSSRARPPASHSLTWKRVLSRQGGAGPALPAWVRSVRESNVIMIPRSGGGGQKVDSRRADEVFAEHGAGRFRKAGSVLAAF